MVPLLRLSGVVLFPGEALPLRITDSCYINYFRQASNARGNPTGAGNTAGTIIGVMCQLPDREDLSTLGTLAEVCSMQCTADEVRLLARGRHRFKLLESHRDGGVLQARVQVLEELEVRPRTAVESRPFPRWVST